MFVRFRLRLLIAVVALLSANETLAAEEPRTSARADGTQIHWYLDRQSAKRSQPVVVLVQGSGCASVLQNQSLRKLKARLPDYAVVMAEKAGVAPGDKPADPMEGCSTDYFQRHTVSGRVSDFQLILSELSQLPWWNGDLVLFGGSEGGAVVTLLAKAVQPDATVVFSSGLGLPLKDSIKSTVPPPVQAMLEAEFAKAKAEPLSAARFGGNSYRWWADVGDRRLSDDLLQVSGPILLVQGEQDQFAPVASARATRSAFDQAKRCNLTYWEFAGYDHFMADASGSQLDQVLTRIAVWIDEAASKPQASACKGPPV